MTPLHRASIEGQDEVVKLLCRRLANVNSPDKVTTQSVDLGGQGVVARSNAVAFGMF